MGDGGCEDQDQDVVLYLLIFFIWCTFIYETQTEVETAPLFGQYVCCHTCPNKITNLCSNFFTQTSFKKSILSAIYLLISFSLQHEQTLPDKTKETHRSTSYGLTSLSSSPLEVRSLYRGALTFDISRISIFFIDRVPQIHEDLLTNSAQYKHTRSSNYNSGGVKT